MFVIVDTKDFPSSCDENSFYYVAVFLRVLTVLVGSAGVKLGGFLTSIDVLLTVHVDEIHSFSFKLFKYYFVDVYKFSREAVSLFMS